MPKYSVECECRREILVELFQAGSLVECAECHRQVTVPSITALKTQAGDQYPLLDVWEKLAKTIENHQPPFDGKCQKCRERDAEQVRAVSFVVMHERNEAGQLHIPFVIKRQYFEEHWKRADFPFLLCRKCHELLWSEWRLAQLKKVLVLLGAFVVIGILIYGVLEGIRTPDEIKRGKELRLGHVMVGLVGSLFITLFSWLAVELGLKPRAIQGDPTTVRWLTEIPIVQDLFRGADECKVFVGAARPRFAPADPKERGH